MFRILKKFIVLPGRRKQLAGEALFYLYSAKLILLIVPVKTAITIHLKKRKHRSERQASLPEIRQALGDADRLSLWKNRCLVKSVAGRWMLQRRGLGSQISFGVKHDDEGKLTAHAWLKSGDFEVVAKGGDYVELSGD